MGQMALSTVLFKDVDKYYLPCLNLQQHISDETQAQALFHSFYLRAIVVLNTILQLFYSSEAIAINNMFFLPNNATHALHRYLKQW